MGLQPLARDLAALAVLAAVAPAHSARAEKSTEPAAAALRAGSTYVAPTVAKVVDRERLAYAAGVASRAADGAPIKVVFVDVPDERLDGFRDRLFERLSLGPRGALVIGTITAITLRTASLTPDQEAAVAVGDSGPLRAPPRRYTEGIAELTYDLGLVIHNSTPNAVPRGLGADRNLRTFSGRFPGEDRGGWSTGAIAAIFAAGAVVLAAVGALALVAIRRRGAA